jgi:xanthine dehydrogenase YagR molybdenum-binding subunit
MQRHGLTEITETFAARPSEERGKYATLAHGAQFVEVQGEPDLGTVHVNGLTIPSPGIVLLGKVDSGADIFDVPGTVDVTVKLSN